MVKNSDAEWKKKLTPEQFWVCRQKGTELVWGIHTKKKKTRNKHVLREHRSGFVGDSIFPLGTVWDAFGFGVNDWDHLDVELYMLSGLLKIYASPSLVDCPSHFNKNHCFLFTVLHIQRKVSHQVSFQKRSVLRSAKQDTVCSANNSRTALVINLLFVSVNSESFFLVSLQPWSGEYLDLKTRGIYKCVCCGSELFRYELMSDVFCKEKIQVPYWRPFPCSFSLTQLSQQVWFSHRMAVISFSSRNVIQ